MYKIKAIIYKPLRTKLNNIIDPPANFVGFYRALVKLDNVKTCTELVMWVWLNAINKLKSYLHSGSADMCVRSHVIALALSLGVPGKPCQLLTDNNIRAI